MTIHRGLAELKLLNSKIEKQIEQTIPTGLKQKDKKVFGYLDLEEFNSKAQSGYDSVLALIERKNKIKCAIIRKNSETEVTVAGKVMTIADAINFKDLVQYKKLFIENMKAKSQKTKSDFDKNNAVVEQNCQRVIEVTFGKDNVKVSPSDIEAVKKPFMEQNEFLLVDPLKIDEKISVLEADVTSFETEVDAVLSEINAVTFIEF